MALELDPPNKKYMEKMCSLDSKVNEYTLIDTWDASKGYNFNNPWRIAIDTMDNVYVADTGNNKIQKFDCEGKKKLEIGLGVIKSPKGVCVDEFNDVYVADTNSHKIRKYDCEGNEIWNIGGWGWGDKKLYHPQSVFVKDGVMYIPEERSYKIKKFDARDNQYIGSILLSDSDDAISNFGSQIWQSITKGNIEREKEIISPVEILIDDDENVFVSDNTWWMGEIFRNHYLRKLDKDGNHIKDFNRRMGDGKYELKYPHQIAMDKCGKVYVVDTGNGRILKCDKEHIIGPIIGNGTKQGIMLKNPHGIAFNTLGDLYITDSENDRILVFSNYKKIKL
jgi:DNA-binding beta-propeller fold protein YncE